MARLTDKQVEEWREHWLKKYGPDFQVQLCDDLLAARAVLDKYEWFEPVEYKGRPIQMSCPCCYSIKPGPHGEDCEWSEARGERE